MIIILFFFVVFSSITLSQEIIERETINTAGSTFKNSQFEFSYSIGEVFVETKSNESIILTQGFQQADINITSNENFDFINDIKIRIYPNPSSDKIIIHNEEDLDYFVSMINSSGKYVLEESKFINAIEEIDISNLANGTYYLIYKTDKKVTKVKLIKMK